jgi:MerR family mercuric resistance operon transcriptional regulator
MKASIAGLARAGGVGVETVRYYQRRGLLETPERVDGGIRRYTGDDLRRLRFIRSAQAAGFTLEKIAELLALDASNDRPRVRTLARERIAALNAEIARLEVARDALKRLEKTCSAGSKGPCPIIAAFDGASARTGPR